MPSGWTRSRFGSISADIKTKQPSIATGTFPTNIIWKAGADGRAHDGTATIVQPLIEPLYDSKNVHEVVQFFFKENFDKKDYDIVKDYWQTRHEITTTAAAATRRKYSERKR